MVEVIYHGHSFVEIKREQKTVFIDPFITGNTTCDLSLEEAIAKKPTAVIITHGHSDHIGDSVALAHQSACQVIATFEVAKRFRQQGIEAVSEQHIGGQVSYDAFAVKYTPAFHGWQIMDSTICGVAAGVLVFVHEKTIYHAGDTALTKEMELIWAYETVDVALLPIGDRYTMGVTDAVRATKMIKPKYVVPIHYDTRPPIKADPIEFSRLVMLDNLATPKVLKPGQLIAL